MIIVIIVVVNEFCLVNVDIDINNICTARVAEETRQNQLNWTKNNQLCVQVYTLMSD